MVVLTAYNAHAFPLSLFCAHGRLNVDLVQAGPSASSVDSSRELPLLNEMTFITQREWAYISSQYGFDAGGLSDNSTSHETRGIRFCLNDVGKVVSDPLPCAICCVSTTKYAYSKKHLWIKKVLTTTGIAGDDGDENPAGRWGKRRRTGEHVPGAASGGISCTPGDDEVEGGRSRLRSRRNCKEISISSDETLLYGFFVCSVCDEFSLHRLSFGRFHF